MQLPLERLVSLRYKLERSLRLQLKHWTSWMFMFLQLVVLVPEVAPEVAVQVFSLQHG